MALPHDTSSFDLKAAARWCTYPCVSAAWLNGDWEALIRELPEVGEVRCITRNAALLHERVGVFDAIEFYDHLGVILGEIDLRLFLGQWHRGVALQEQTPEGLRRSLLILDRSEAPLLQIVLEKGGDVAAFGKLLERYTLKEGEAPVPNPHALAEPELLPDEAVDVAGFQQAWLALEDTATFAEMLQSYGVHREQALRLAPEGHARPVRTDAPRLVLEAAREASLPVMIFGRSAGCLQSHTGEVAAWSVADDQHLAIEEERFRFRLDLSAIASAWVVRKPTLDGYITSLELFDAQHENIGLFFGKRDYGQPEDERWRAILAQLV